MRLNIISEGDYVKDRVTRGKGEVLRVRGLNGHRYALIDWDRDWCPDWIPVADLMKLTQRSDGDT